MADTEWQVATLSELEATGAKEFSIGDGVWPLRGFLVVWDGAVHAYENRCPHAGHPLNLDPTRFFEATGELLVCSSHGALFEPSTGVCVGGPCPGKRLRVLPCRTDGAAVYVTAAATELRS